MVVVNARVWNEWIWFSFQLKYKWEEETTCQEGDKMKKCNSLQKKNKQQIKYSDQKAGKEKINPILNILKNKKE